MFDWVLQVVPAGNEPGWQDCLPAERTGLQPGQTVQYAGPAVEVAAGSGRGHPPGAQSLQAQGAAL